MSFTLVDVGVCMCHIPDFSFSVNNEIIEMKLIYISERFKVILNSDFVNCSIFFFAWLIELFQVG